MAGETLQQNVEHLYEGVAERAEQARHGTLRFGQDAAYALLGTAAYAVDSTFRMARRALGLPRDAMRAARHAPERFREGFAEMSERGRELVRRVEQQPSTRQAARQGRRARAQAGAAATSARRAARRTAQATRQGARAAGSSTVYEDRTYDELYQLATERNIEGRSNMTKEQLIEALRS